VKKVLITGAAGFIGSHAVKMFGDLGYDVVALDVKPSGNKIDWPIGVINVKADILNDDIERYVAEADLVVHLAALAGMKQGIFNPYGSMDNNLHATKIVSDLCIKYDVELFFASTSEVYGVCADVPLREDSNRTVGPTWDNRWGYSESKAMSERLILLDVKEHGLRAKIGRFFNVAGPMQSGEYGMVMPRFIEAAKIGDTVTIYGDGSQTRSFCHVTDAVRGIAEVCLYGHVGEVYNIGNPSEISIKDLADFVIKIAKSNSHTSYLPYEDVYPGYTEIPRRVPDISKIMSLGWEPKLNLDDIVRDLL
jgi:UDP-glucose 4-epimerase